MKQFRGALLLTLTALIWGTAFVAQSLGMDYLGPFTFNGVRNFVAAVGLLPVIAFLRRRQGKAEARGAAGNSRKTLWVGGVLCGLALGVASSLQQIGIQFTTVGKAGFLTALYIVIVPLLGLLLKKRVALPVWVSVVIAAAGTYLLSIQEDFTIAAGDLFVILCAVCFSVHILLVDRFSPSVNGVELSCIQFLVAGVFSTIVAFLVETPNVQDILRSWGADPLHGPDLERRRLYAPDPRPEGHAACGRLADHEPRVRLCGALRLAAARPGHDGPGGGRLRARLCRGRSGADPVRRAARPQRREKTRIKARRGFLFPKSCVIV